jgi:hypothetical protein
VIGKELLDDYELTGNNINRFNQQLHHELSQLVDEFDSENLISLRKKYASPLSSWHRVMLYLPGFAGKWSHAPLYLPVRSLSLKKAAPDGHYDAVLIGMLLLLYPLYLALISLLIHLMAGGWYWILPWIILPFLAWAFVQSKRR